MSDELLREKLGNARSSLQTKLTVSLQPRTAPFNTTEWPGGAAAAGSVRIEGTRPSVGRQCDVTIPFDISAFSTILQQYRQTKQKPPRAAQIMSAKQPCKRWFFLPMLSLRYW